MNVSEIQKALASKSSALRGEYEKEYSEEPSRESDIRLIRLEAQIDLLDELVRALF